MGVREGHGCGIGVVDAFAPAGYPNSLKRTVALHQGYNLTQRWQPLLMVASRPIEAQGALHSGIQHNGGIQSKVADQPKAEPQR